MSDRNLQELADELNDWATLVSDLSGGDFDPESVDLENIYNMAARHIPTADTADVREAFPGDDLEDGIDVATARERLSDLVGDGNEMESEYYDDREAEEKDYEMARETLREHGYDDTEREAENCPEMELEEMAEKMAEAVLYDTDNETANKAEEGDDEEREMDEEEYKAEIEELRERVAKLESEQDSYMSASKVRAELSALKGEVADADKVEDVDKRLSALEEEPVEGVTLADGSDADSDDEWLDASTSFDTATGL